MLKNNEIDDDELKRLKKSTKKKRELFVKIFLRALDGVQDDGALVAIDKGMALALTPDRLQLWMDCVDEAGILLKEARAIHLFEVDLTKL